MSDSKLSFTLAGLEITTTEQANPVIPTWLAEALLVGQYWHQSGLLERLQQQVQVSRGPASDCGFDDTRETRQVQSL